MKVNDSGNRRKVIPAELMGGKKLLNGKYFFYLMVINVKFIDKCEIHCSIFGIHHPQHVINVKSIVLYLKFTIPKKLSF